jgi:hypothetical protein
MSHDRNRNDGSCCHDVREAVFRVQGLYLNIENSQKSSKKLLQNQENAVYKVLHFFLIFHLFYMIFYFMFLYLDMDPEHSPFNMMATTNIISIF